MPILSDISRRLHLLTTDAMPDPPRNGVDGYTNNLPPSASETTEKSNSTAEETTHRDEIQDNHQDRRSSTDKHPNDSGTTNLENGGSSTENKRNSRETNYPRVRTKIPYKTGTAQTANIVNYNIVNSNRVKIGATTTYVWNVNDCTKNNDETLNGGSMRIKKRTMPKTVNDLSTCEREITIDDIFVIKSHLGHGWRDVMRRLGYSEGQMDQFEENHRGKGIDEVIYQAFLDWKQANTKDAKIGILTSILWSCREYDCAERLAAASNQDTPT